MPTFALPFAYRVDTEGPYGRRREWSVDVREVEIPAFDDWERVSVSDEKGGNRRFFQMHVREGGRLHVRFPRTLSTSVMTFVNQLDDPMTDKTAHGPVPGLATGTSGVVASTRRLDPEAPDVVWTDYAVRRSQVLDYASLLSLDSRSASVMSAHLQPVCAVPFGIGASIVPQLELRDVVLGWRIPRAGFVPVAGKAVLAQAVLHAPHESEGGHVRLHCGVEVERFADTVAFAVVDAAHLLAEHLRAMDGWETGLSDPHVAYDLIEAAGALADTASPLPDMAEVAGRARRLFEAFVEGMEMRGDENVSRNAVAYARLLERMRVAETRIETVPAGPPPVDEDAIGALLP